MTQGAPVPYSGLLDMVDPHVVNGRPYALATPHRKRSAASR
jgi:hypothetical protein